MKASKVSFLPPIEGFEARGVALNDRMELQPMFVGAAKFTVAARLLVEMDDGSVQMSVLRIHRDTGKVTIQAVNEADDSEEPAEAATPAADGSVTNAQA